MQGSVKRFLDYFSITTESSCAPRRFGLSAVVLALLLVAGLVTARGQGLSVLDLQPWLVKSSAMVKSEPGGSVKLINLNPNIDSWYILEYRTASGVTRSYHLENAFPGIYKLELDELAGRVLVKDSTGDRCVLWQAGRDSLFNLSQNTKRPFVELCNGTVYLRNQTEGRRTKKEWAVDLLRDRVKYGENITNFIKEKFFRDKYRQTGISQNQKAAGADPSHRGRPVRLKTIARADSIALNAPELNFTIERDPGGGMRPGRWYPVPGYAGVFVSSVRPELVQQESSWVQRGLLSPLEDKELSALVYLVAFDLSMFDLGFALGTDHPRVGWSDRIPESSRDSELPGPDGFDNVFPLVRTGKINPREVTKVAATFAGGFKRSHGAFKWGDLANQNHGTHYGFMVNGVVISILQPGLATLLVHDDGRVDMQTWKKEDSVLLPHIRYARQNGVPLLEPDTGSWSLLPGRFVKDWAKGNWSGSESKELRTLRAGTCIQETDSTSFLIYAYFSAAIPSTMARVLNSCNCSYAMHLDMNAPEHTYLAIYRVEEDQFVVQRLVKEMAEVDPPVDGVELPRYIGYSDNRDFFYLLRKDKAEVTE
ncbi:MAG: hypothetical protein ABII79_14610 [bacterium]